MLVESIKYGLPLNIANADPLNIPDEGYADVIGSLPFNGFDGPQQQKEYESRAGLLNG
jgi:hypothetical protein